ncbi:ribonuclease HII [Halalkalicoccus jeotgali]|uniref:Ribonuclease HII n=1 Tax=Halalkalicoccus jeotgali (strain DSM 18796 / CECT 7217 / JCM 14584 / KCTC 4019 / B3) TaxID=795797 RepID=D8J8Y2_HALJB|nr:ribonuclease HII [Halalkalicoccus jeotgali]ADJ14317.1 ribonuclease HII [Halalkalicoccus jeotgali B3]ELY40580.1 ribonuclease HII [Halalkalicoccus jeotgali B3]
MCRFGIDEAGKGPVLGPMIAACVCVPDESVLPEGIDDSKRLTPAKRGRLSEALLGDEAIGIGIAAVSPDRIDTPETDMNSLTVAAHAEAASEVVEPGMTGICDAGDVDAGRFVHRVGQRLPEGVSLSGEHGADEHHAIVGAASVVAKVERDRRVAALEAAYGEVGSGYPSDPTTREFLAEYVAENGELPECARASWKTSADALAAVEQGTLAEF